MVVSDDGAAAHSDELMARLERMLDDRRESAFEAVTREQLAELKADVRAIEERLDDLPSLREVKRELMEVKRLVGGLIGAVGVAILVELVRIGLGLAK